MSEQVLRYHSISPEELQAATRASGLNVLKAIASELGKPVLARLDALEAKQSLLDELLRRVSELENK